MGDLKINEKTLFSQSGSAEPSMGSTITDIPAAGVTGTLVNAVQDNITRLGTVTSGTLGSGIDVKGAGGLAMVYLAGISATNTSALSIDGFFSSDYEHYKFVYSITAETTNTDIAIRIRQSNSDITGANYRYAALAAYHDENNATSTDNIQSDWNGTYIHIGAGDSPKSTTHPSCGELTLYNALSTTSVKNVTGQTNSYNSTTPTPNAVRNYQFAGYYYESSPAALSGLSFLHDGGNTTGTVRLYGFRNS